MIARWPAWREFARTNARLAYIYRFNMLSSLALTGITIYLLTVVWRAAYGDASSVAGLTRHQTLVYLTIANLQVYFLAPETSGDIQDRIRTGQISFDISRPISYPGQLIAGAFGDMIGVLPMLFVAVPIAFVAGELTWPASIAAGIGYLVSFLLAWLVAVEMNMLIGLISFWTLEMTGFQMVYRLIGNFATGALIPLWFMPDLLRAIVQALPFQSIGFIPVSIYIGQPATGSILGALGVQAFWAIAMIGVLRFVWSRALQHTVVQGG